MMIAMLFRSVLPMKSSMLSAIVRRFNMRAIDEKQDVHGIACKERLA